MWDWLTLHNVALFAVSVIGVQGLQWLSKWLDGQGATYVQAEIQKLHSELDQTTAGKFLMQFHAEAALFTMVENAVPVVFQELSDEIKSNLSTGNLKDVDWKKIGVTVWSKIRDQAQGGWHDYLHHSSYSDGEAMSAKISETIFSKLHMNYAIAAVKNQKIDPVAIGTVQQDKQ